MTLRQSILATIAYHDIFDYPLSAEEIHHYLIGQVANRQSIEKTLLSLSEARTIGAQNGHYFLKNRPTIVALRKQRE